MCVSIQNPLCCSLKRGDGRIRSRLRPVLCIAVIDEDGTYARGLARRDVLPSIPDEV